MARTLNRRDRRAAKKRIKLPKGCSFTADSFVYETEAGEKLIFPRFEDAVLFGDYVDNRKKSQEDFASTLLELILNEDELAAFDDLDIVEGSRVSDGWIAEITQEEFFRREAKAIEDRITYEDDRLVYTPADAGDDADDPEDDPRIFLPRAGTTIKQGFVRRHGHLDAEDLAYAALIEYATTEAVDAIRNLPIAEGIVLLLTWQNDKGASLGE
ncbi:hypothetical protein OS128_05150 [Corynebacterium sp. P5848]|uniref:hypothetical protein n=1 Tax=Corynebacterium marambiense TaxID=2765364 RepID=UPI002260864A|nr:hypothetical protein [Corynebacterium marambiense]MCX7542297.1 hypothetical protein [Corynebacterium marambiense]